MHDSVWCEIYSTDVDEAIGLDTSPQKWATRPGSASVRAGVKHSSRQADMHWHRQRRLQITKIDRIRHRIITRSKNPIKSHIEKMPLHKKWTTRLILLPG